MNIETLKKAGICFDYSRNAVFPQIPRVQDVLYALQLADEKDAHGNYCPAGAMNCGEYLANLMLVAAAVASKVLYMERYDEAEAKKIIAAAIIELCPPEARCLFSDAFVEAQEIFVGQPAPSRRASHEETIAVCGCPECAWKVQQDREHQISAMLRLCSGDPSGVITRNAILRGW